MAMAAFSHEVTPARVNLEQTAVLTEARVLLPTSDWTLRLSRGILDVFCPCPMVRPVPLGKRRHSQRPSRRNAAEAAFLGCGAGRALAHRLAAHESRHSEVERGREMHE